jgi:hypothetical protein
MTTCLDQAATILAKYLNDVPKALEDSAVAQTIAVINKQLGVMLVEERGQNLSSVADASA